MKTVLLAWELGTGTGHLGLLDRLARRLASRRLRLVAAVKRPDMATALRARGVEVVPAPPWPSARRSAAAIAATSSASMGDMLATAAQSDADALSALLGGWQALLAAVRPDMVVADFAPAAGLAARERRVPVLHVGNGYTLPPAELPRFPPLHALAPPQDERVALQTFNVALAATGMRRLDRLPEVFEGDARLVLALPLLDPYAAHRSEPVHGPLLPYRPAAAEPDGRTVFAYLSPGYRPHGDLPDCLVALAPRLRVHAPVLPDGVLRRLAEAGARVEADPAPMPEALRSASLVLHFGGGQLAAEALLAGVPQLVLSMQVEQWLTGAALRGAGVAHHAPAFDPTARLAPAVDACLGDPSLAGAAAHAGARHRAFLAGADPSDRFDHLCATLLGL